MNERQIIERCFRGAAKSGNAVLTGIGDDAAVVDGKGRLTMTMDSLVEGQHFRSDDTPEDVGYKALAVNLSDLAAMGSLPRWAMLSLSLPQDIDSAWVAGFAEGFFELAEQWGVTLIGGDLVRGPLTVTVQATGEAGRCGSLCRDGAGPGDGVYLSGDVGDAGFAWHRRAQLQRAFENSPEIAAQCLRRLLRPTPRIAEGAALVGTATAAIDVSDGVLLDLLRLAEASAAGAVVELDKVPLGRGVSTLLEEQDRLLPFTTGDDYELLFTVPDDRKENLYAQFRKLNTAVTQVGFITERKGLRCLLHGQEIPLPDRLGFDHFNSAPV